MGRDGTEPKSSRIFHQCYLNCCKLQNLTPLTNVIPSSNGKVVDFCVDRIKYADWPPILNALSCDLSLHTVAIKCRQQVKTVLEHIDCERLAKTVTKRCVVLTNFMLSNLVEAIAQLLSNTTLLKTLLLEGIPLRIPYLNPLCKALAANSCLQHLYLQRCLIGDAGCLAICTSMKGLPNISTLDLSGCELTPLGAGYLADLIKFQKIHRYSENWTHTLRYRLPELDSMGGLRRITVCLNPELGDEGVGKLLDVLSDDLWIKALDIQSCGITEKTTAAVLQMLTSNKTLVVIDLRCNNISSESLSKVRSTLRDNERGTEGKFSWLASPSSGSSSDRLLKSIASKTAISKDRTVSNLRAQPRKYVSKSGPTGQKEKDYAEALEEQLQAEISHRQQLEELNLQLVEQLNQLKLQLSQLWSNSGRVSSGSEHSLQTSVSGDLSSSSGSDSPIPLDQHTVCYVQQAFKDIYKFIKNNQCPMAVNGQCIHEVPNASVSNTESVPEKVRVDPPPIEAIEEVDEPACSDELPSYSEELRINIRSKRPQSSHTMVEKMKVNKTTKSAHLLSDLQQMNVVEMKLGMIERQMGDTMDSHRDETLENNIILTESKPNKKNTQELSSPCSSVVSDSETLICSPQITQRSTHPTPAFVNPRDVLYSSSDEDES